MKYYVYHWVRKDINEPFYVGKGTGNRAGRKKSNKGWKNITSKVECFWEILKYFDDEQKAYLYEHTLIEKYKKLGYKIINQTEYSKGGNTWAYTDEVKQRQSKNRKGKGLGPRSEEWKQNISKANKGRNILWANKIGDALRGIPKNYPNPNKKIIYQYDINNNLINQYNSAAEAGKALNKSGNSIADCAAGRQKTAYGFKWKYKLI
jgi:stalled ribosome alternative rescue factor ArfA